MPAIAVGNGTTDGFAGFVDWCHALFEEKPGIQQHGESAGSFNLKLTDGPELTFKRDPASGAVTVESLVILPPDIVGTIQEASNRAASGSLGKTQWWRVKLASRHELDATFGLHMMRMLGQRRTYSGKWRLGEDVLVEFSVDDPKQLAAFAKQNISATFRSIGPGFGPRASRFARGQADVLRAILSFVTATPLDASPMIEPVRDTEFPPGHAVHPSLPELAVHGLALWSRLAEAASVGGGDFVTRVINALTAYEHALYQPTGDAATVFYVSSIEALATPNHRYEQSRATARFVDTLVRLARPKLEESIAHANFAEAFGAIKSVRRLAQRLYALRSKPVHTGKFGLDRNSFFGAFSIEGPVRSALLAEIAEFAILEFVRCPFTSLIGHMDFDPSTRLDLTDEEREMVQQAARARGLGTEDFIRQALGLSSSRDQQ